MFTYIPLATIWFRKEALDVIKLWILPLTFMFDFGVFLIWVLSKIDDLGWAGVDGWLRTSGWVLCSLLALLLGSNWCDLWFGFRVRGNILSFFCWIVGDDIGWLAYGTSWIIPGLFTGVVTLEVRWFWPSDTSLPYPAWLTEADWVDWAGMLSIWV